MLVNENLLEEIETKRLKVDKNPQFYLALNSQAETNLESYSKLYSWWIEHPDIRGQILAENITTKDKGKLISVARRGIERLHDAWSYLQRIDDPLNKQVIINLSHIIEPQENDGLRFRQDRVSMGLREYTPPNPLRIEEKLTKEFEDIREGGYHPVEKAIKAHLVIAGLQPFNNGNKRTARLVQEKILRNSNLPTALIPVGERQTYIDLLEQALVGWRDSQTMKELLNSGKLDCEDSIKAETNFRVSIGKQISFFNYISGKVNSALDGIIGDIFLADVGVDRSSPVYQRLLKSNRKVISRGLLHYGIPIIKKY